MTQQQLADIAAPYVIGLFNQYDTSDLYFHDLEHTTNVAMRVTEIGQHEHVTPEEQLILQVAALFHDTGHLNGGVEQHEIRSVALMRAFAEMNSFTDAAFLAAVEQCILATRMPHNPTSKLEEIMCDADMYHFGTPAFRETNKLVKKEFIARGYEHWTKGWLQHTYDLLLQQHYFTPWCQQQLNAGKQENLEWIRKKLLKKKEEEGTKEEVAAISKPKKEKAKEDPAREQEKQNQRLVARGVQTVLRLASSNHLELSQMADGKANILISVNAIIISVILSVLINRLDVDTYLTIPTILFLTSSVVTIVIAILATRPKLTEGIFKKEDILNRKTNLLFFGNFYKSTLQDYEWAMNYLLEDKDYIHGTQIMDIYYLGKVLGRKYKFIRLAYTIFMIGIIASAVAFMLAVLLNTPKGHITIIDGTAKPL